MKAQVFTFMDINVIISPVVKKRWFREDTVTFNIQYDKDELVSKGVSEDALLTEVRTFMKE